MLDMALKNLWARKSRTTLVVLVVVVCVFLITTVDGMLSTMQANLERDMDRQADRMYLRQAGSGYPPFGSSLPEAVVRDALAHPGVNAAESTPLLLLVIAPSDGPMDPASIAGVGIAPGKERVYTGDATAAAGAGTLLGAPENAVVLGAKAADYYGASPGQTLDVNGETAQVVGVLADQRTYSIDTAVFMHLSFAQRAFGKEGMVSAALLTPETPGRADDLVSDLAARFPKLEVAANAAIRDEAGKAMEMPNRFMSMISWTVFAAAILVVTNVMLIAVRERTREIGTLSALGMRPRTLLLTILYEALFLMVIGGAVGIVLTVPAAQLGDWRIHSYVEVVRMGVLILLVGGFATLYPAYRATRISPVEALRYE